MSLRHRMNRSAWVLGLALALPGVAAAAEPQRTPGLLPTEIARPLLDNDLGVRAAKGHAPLNEPLG